MVFLIRVSCHKTTHANGYNGAWPGWAVSISVLPLTPSKILPPLLRGTWGNLSSTDSTDHPLIHPLPVYPHSQGTHSLQREPAPWYCRADPTKCGICSEIDLHPLTNLLAFQGSVMAQCPTSFFIPLSLGRIPPNHPCGHHTAGPQV